MDLLESMKFCIEQASADKNNDSINLGTEIDFEILGDVSGSISLSLVPSSPLGEYLDRARFADVLVQVKTKHKDMKAAKDLCAMIQDFYVENTVVSLNGSFKEIKCTPYVAPTFVTKTENNLYVYTTMLTLNLFIK